MLKEIIDIMNEQQILVTAIQETCLGGEGPFEFDGYRILETKIDKKIPKDKNAV